MSEYCPLCQGDPRRREHLTEHERHLAVSALRRQACDDAKTHYGGDMEQGRAGELNALADKFDSQPMNDEEARMRALAEELT